MIMMIILAMTVVMVIINHYDFIIVLIVIHGCHGTQRHSSRQNNHNAKSDDSLKIPLRGLYKAGSNMRG